MSDHLPEPRPDVERPKWLDGWLDYPHTGLDVTGAREACWYAQHLADELATARTRIERLGQERGELLQVVRSAEECLRHQPCCHMEADWVASCRNISENARTAIAKSEASQ